MAALDFPASPAVGDKYPQPAVDGVPVYTWTGTVWTTNAGDMGGGGGGTTVIVSDTPPVGAKDNSLWYESDTGLTYLYLNDGTSKQWVIVATPFKPATDLTGAVRYDLAQGLTAAQQSQARSNIGSLQKNYIINGGMQISQQNGATASTTMGYYPADMFCVTGTFAAGAISIQQGTYSGNQWRITALINSGPGSVGASDYWGFMTNIEGLRAADLGLGTAAAKTVTVQFGWRGPAGSYSLAFRNAAATRGYVVPFVIAAGEANVDVVRSITIPLDQAGSWPVSNTSLIQLFWTPYAGATYQGAPNTWLAANVLAANGAGANYPNGSNIQLFDVSLTVGTTAPPFQMPDYVSELNLCRRYWQQYYYALTAWHGDGNAYVSTQQHPIAMRASPTLDVSGMTAPGGGGNVNPYPTYQADANYFAVTTAAGVAITSVGGNVKLSARM
jgi:hypothetical protein